MNLWYLWATDKYLPAKERESDGQNQSLKADAGVEVMKGGVMSVAITGFGYRKPCILWV